MSFRLQISKFIKLTKSELFRPPRKKRKTAPLWTIDESKYLGIHQVRNLLRNSNQVRRVKTNGRDYPNIRNWFMVELGLFSGLRVAEMAALRIGDLQLREGSSFLTIVGKGNKPRTVRFGDGFAKSCHEFIDFKNRCGQPTGKKSFLLTKRTGGNLTTRALQKAFKLCLKKAGFDPRFGIHCLRHTYGTYLYRASGHNLRLVQQQLGHASVRTTEVYVDLLAEDTAIAMDRLYQDNQSPRSNR